MIFNPNVDNSSDIKVETQSMFFFDMSSLKPGIECFFVNRKLFGFHGILVENSWDQQIDFMG